MDADVKKVSENFPKIDTIWSEADENLVIKEEIVSDFEPEPPASPKEEENEVHDFENDKCWDDCGGVATCQKKALKSKSLKNEEIEIFMYKKSCCTHDPKNFVMVKRRLRCGNCRSLVCPECCKVMSLTLSSHFLGHGVNKSDVFVCRLCSIIFHSLCALQAHIRIHSMEIPYVCPDCGLIYNNIHFLILHLQNKCFHVYKTARYKCKDCPGLYFKAESFGQHVQDVHLEYIFRCLYCSSLFTNHEEFNYHMSKLHRKQKAQYLNYYRCSLCANIIIPKFMYEKHIAHHRDNPTVYEIHYQCVCGETFNAIGAFRAHALYCNFKKVMPYQWRFLQEKFKRQEISLQQPNKIISEPPALEYKPDGEFKVDEKNCIEMNGSRDEGDICHVEIVETNKPNVIDITDAPENDPVESTNNECVGVSESEEISKNYDHIPCDHLGYVIKSQSSDKKAEAVDEEKNCKNYKIVTELNEKTGVMKEKSVPVDEAVNDEENEEVDNPDDLIENDDKMQKANSVKCPFCAVFFSKHSLTFQQFKIHIDSNHPDAAIDVLVNGEDRIKANASSENGSSKKDNEEKGNSKVKDLWDVSISIKSSDQRLAEEYSEKINLESKNPKEPEKSRRESEVWSELYESLMLAEKLKKKKSPPASDGKRKALVSDYSSKRVVKKPKRYGESSDSGESNDNSDFDEFPIDNELLEKVNSGETEQEKTDKDGLTKRQKLLLKLENVDGRLADYLLDLITKKEKMFELYKKHSLPRAGHDLRSYRRKVLNGIKRGRPFKVLRCHDSLKYSLIDRQKKKDEFYPGSKSLERKRGRPRKYQDIGKIKERRRSDKEVSFIEKNFEKDENEMSPSKRKRKLSSKLQYYKNLTEEKDDFSSGQVIVNKVEPNKVFTCAVCKLVFLESNEFRVHVTLHRTEKNMYQCMECGECFVVRPSLEKHLLAFHKIKNTDKYISENECCSVKKEEPEEEPLKENQCKVCKDQFDKASDLTKHFRIHGMAFLKEFKKEGKVK